MSIVKAIIFFGEPCALACDALCEKAWGRNNRPRRQLGSEEDDYVYLADQDLGVAPEDPGTYEGGHAKPRVPEERLNKWCARECERSVIVGQGQLAPLPDLSSTGPNIPRLEPSHT